MGPLQNDDVPYVSTGQLPSPEQVRRAVDEAYERYRAAAGGLRRQPGIGAPEHWRNQRGHPRRTIAWAISGTIGLGVAMVTAGSSSSPPCSPRWHQAAVGAAAARAEPTRTTTMLKEENR